MKVIPVEEKLINLLTGIVWWFSVRWERGTIFVFFLFSFVVPVIYSLLISFVEVVSSTGIISLFRLIVLFAIVPFLYGFAVSLIPVQMVLIQWIEKRINVFKETKNSPNSNRYNGWIWKARISFIRA